MSQRERMTWGKNASGPTLPVEEAKKRASAHPATPDEGITHPAGYKDPEANAYENGDTSSWAEDPKGPPYRTSPAPAVPVDDGGYKHPATQPGAPQKNASHDLRARVEQKAALCIRIAQHLLGKEASVDMVEDQALDFMDISDGRIASTLRRIEAATEDPETLLRRMTAEEEGSPEDKKEDAEEDKGKKAADDRMAEVITALSGIRAEMEQMKSGWGARAEAPKPEAMKSADAMLADMMKEEAAKAAAPMYGGEDKEAEEMLAKMLAEEQAGPPVDVKPEAKTLSQFMEEDISLDPILDDPMGLDPAAMPMDDEAILSSLFASRNAADDEEEKDEDKKAGKKAKKADDDEEEADEKEESDVEEKDKEVEEEEVDGKEGAKKKASQGQVVSQLRPQPKKASAGARTVGTQVRTAAAAGDVSELAKLWDSAPDVSKVFGN